MAALIRCARFCVPSVQIPKILRVVSSVSLQASTGQKGTTQKHQRSWHSTLAERIEMPQSAGGTGSGTSKLENQMNAVERYMRQFGRISRKQLDPIVSSLDKEGTINTYNSLSLLRLYGSALFDESPASRLKLAQELWEKYKEYGIPLEVSHYNTLLAVYNQNKMDFSPTEFLASMEANGITPNRVTYQRLLLRFCDLGDIQGATKVLEHMKAASLPINDQVFNSFITGHLRANDPDNARNIIEVMRQSGLEPTNTTYMTLAVGFAERGEIEEVKKYIKQAEIENVQLRPGQLMEVYAALATSGYNQYLKEVMTFLHAGVSFNQDAIRVCNQLIAGGFEDAAYQLFLEMPKPTRVDADQTTLGRFFLRALARHKRPVEKVTEFVNNMREKEVNKDDLSAVAQLAYLEGQPEYALSVLEKMKEEGLPVRAHYFWPALCQFRDTKNKAGIYKTLDKMNKLSNSRDDFILTVHSYAIPALVSVGETEASILTDLQKYGFQEEEANFAYFLYLLESDKNIQSATDFLNSHKVTVAMSAVRACLLPFLRNNIDWKTVLPMLAELKAQSKTWRGPALEITALILKPVLVAQRKADWADVQDIFRFLEENDLKIFKRSQLELTEYFAGAPDEVMQKLNNLVSSERSNEGVSCKTAASHILKQNFHTSIHPIESGKPVEPLSYDMSLAQLKQQVENNPQNKGAQKRLLIKACAVGAVQEAEKVKSALEAEGFVFPPQALAQLGYLYSMFVKDAGKAQDYLQQLETNFPEYQNYQAVVLKLAALQASQGNTDLAVETLQKYAEKQKDVIKEQARQKEEYFIDVVNGAADADAANKLMDTLSTCGYLPGDSNFLLSSYMGKVVESGEADRILEEFQKCVKTHRCSPNVDKVLQFFINKEDPDRLQKVVDLLTELHGLMNVFHHLIAAFIECGHIKKARKIMETPGLRANMQRLNYYCQSFIERSMMKELEILVEVTKDMFGVDRDNMLFHLMRGYVNQKDLARAKDVLLQYEDEMIQPSVRTLRFLARSLEKAGEAVPYEVPEFQPMEVAAQKTAQKTAQKPASKPVTEGDAKDSSASVSPAALHLKKSIEEGEIEEVLTALQRSEKGALSEAVAQMKRPWPHAALVSIFETLGKQGNMDSLSAIVENRLPLNLKNSLKANIFTAAVSSGRAQEMLDKMETVSVNTARYLTFSSLDALQSKSPELMDRVESLARRLMSEKKYTDPLSVLWCYYKFNNSPKADQILNEIPGFDKSVLTGSLCQAAVQENKVDMLESVLKMKKDLDEKRGMGVAYSALLRYHANQDDVDTLQKTCERIVKDGITNADLRRNDVARAENLLKKESKPLPAWGDDSSTSSDSDSSSSSDEEKR